nr:hypothetical protein Iba_chr05bCG11460 [Ipomoea batatas]
MQENYQFVEWRVLGLALTTFLRKMVYEEARFTLKIGRVLKYSELNQLSKCKDFTGREKPTVIT